MATCKTCGTVDNFLPPTWSNWECLLCFMEELTDDGQLNFEVYNEQIMRMRKVVVDITMDVVDRVIALAVKKAEHGG